MYLHVKDRAGKRGEWPLLPPYRTVLFSASVHVSMFRSRAFHKNTEITTKYLFWNEENTVMEADIPQIPQNPEKKKPALI